MLCTKNYQSVEVNYTSKINKLIEKRDQIGVYQRRGVEGWGLG